MDAIERMAKEDRMVACPVCGGNGASNHGKGQDACERCEGEGYLDREALDPGTDREFDAVDVEEALYQMFEEVGEDYLPGFSATGFRDAMLLTRDRGIVLRNNDGTEFQISIVKSGRKRW